ncbi:MAG: type II toxin-antitoxin system RelE/ParE family toxin [Terracidiphilus sp.]
MRTRVSRSARRELDGIFDNWARRATPDIARELIYSITDQFGILARHPQIGRKCDEFAPGARCFPAGKYLIYYRNARRAMQILHVFHGARDQVRAFRKG